MAMGEADVEGEVGSRKNIMAGDMKNTTCEAVDDFEHMKTYGIWAALEAPKPAQDGKSQLFWFDLNMPRTLTFKVWDSSLRRSSFVCCFGSSGLSTCL